MRTAALPLLPAERLASLAEDYARLRRAERRRVLAGAAVALLPSLLSLRVAEVDPALLWERGGNFFG